MVFSFAVRTVLAQQMSSDCSFFCSLEAFEKALDCWWSDCEQPGREQSPTQDTSTGRQRISLLNHCADLLHFSFWGIFDYPFSLFSSYRSVQIFCLGVSWQFCIYRNFFLKPIYCCTVPIELRKSVTTESVVFPFKFDFANLLFFLSSCSKFYLVNLFRDKILIFFYFC